MNNITNLNEKLFLKASLIETSDKAPSILDSFSGWLMGGFAATASLFVSNYDTLLKHLCPDAIHLFLILFLWTIVFGIFEKYLSILIRSHAAGDAIGSKNIEKLGDKVADFDFQFISAETGKHLLPFARWYFRRSLAKVHAGDLTASSRTFLRLAQFQGLFVLFQAFLILFAVYTIAYSFTGL